VLQDKLFTEIYRIHEKEIKGKVFIYFVYAILVVFILSACSHKNFSAKPVYQFKIYPEIRIIVTLITGLHIRRNRTHQTVYQHHYSKIN
jgi:hypothetical protein